MNGWILLTAMVFSDAGSDVLLSRGTKQVAQASEHQSRNILGIVTRAMQNLSVVGAGILAAIHFGAFLACSRMGPQPNYSGRSARLCARHHRGAVSAWRTCKPHPLDRGWTYCCWRSNHVYDLKAQAAGFHRAIRRQAHKVLGVWLAEDRCATGAVSWRRHEDARAVAQTSMGQ
jgi:hypothetical protein